MLANNMLTMLIHTLLLLLLLLLFLYNFCMLSFQKWKLDHFQLPVWKKYKIYIENSKLCMQLCWICRYISSAVITLDTYFPNHVSACHIFIDILFCWLAVGLYELLTGFFEGEGGGGVLLLDFSMETTDVRHIEKHFWSMWVVYGPMW